MSFVVAEEWVQLGLRAGAVVFRDVQVAPPGPGLRAEIAREVQAVRARFAGPAAVRACTADDLGVWLAVAQLDGAAGSVYYPLQFTNLSRHACAMRGFAGVSAVDRNLHQLGSPAGRAHVVPVRTVVLAPGRTAHAVLRYGDVTVSTAPGCHPTFRTFELRVYPPGQYHATYAAFDFEVCSHAGPVYMDIGPIQAGVGTRV